MASKELTTGTTLAGRYRLASLLGKGGAGKVFEGEDSSLSNRRVAIKIMKLSSRDKSSNQLNLKIFKKESKLLSSLKHNGIPSIYDSFVEDDFACLVMEYVEGDNLQRVLEASEGGIPEEKLLSWFLDIALILKYLHHQKPPIIFRDIKPANIILQEDGKVKLVDFGIAQAFDSERKSTSLMTKGTLGYAPPEQFNADEKVDVRADIYSLGATIHHLATGEDPRNKPPFSFEPVRKANPELSESFENIISRCLEPDKINRYQAIDKLIRDLKRLKAGRKVRAKPGEKSKLPVIAASLAVLLIITAWIFTGAQINEFNRATGSLSFHSIPQNGSEIAPDIKEVRLVFNASLDRESAKGKIFIKDKPLAGLKWEKDDTVCVIPIPKGSITNDTDELIIKMTNSGIRDKYDRVLTVPINHKLSYGLNYIAVKFPVKR